MNQKKLPNATIVLVLGICSIITCICYGIVGLIMAIIALILYHKDIKLYQADPQAYTNFPNLSIGRILSIIGLCLNTLSLIVYIYLIAFLGEQGMRDLKHNMELKLKQQQEMTK